MASQRMIDRLSATRRNALIAGAAGLALCAVAFLLDRPHFFQAYLTAWLFWTGLSLGSLGVLLLHSATGGSWGVEIRRILEASARQIPVQALFFLPILLGLKDLYVWARPEVVASDELIRHKAGYLNVPFWIVRAAFYFVVWIVLSRAAERLSIRQDRELSRDTARTLRRLSGPGIILYILTMTLAAVDWVMSLDPHWFSTIFGLILVVGQVLSAFAFSVIADVLFFDRKPVPPGNPESPLYDLGNLLLAFVMIWAYVNFSQFLIIWQANLAEEIPWYLRRLTGGWQLVGLSLVFFQFMLPFLCLIFRGIKRNPVRLAQVAALILLMRFIDVFWIVSPAGDMSEALALHWAQLAAPVGIGGIWLLLFLSDLRQRWDVPAQDMHETEELEHARA